jgi:Zn-dependent alcohol dehydrogenases, class III
MTHGKHARDWARKMFARMPEPGCVSLGPISRPPLVFALWPLPRRISRPCGEAGEGVNCALTSKFENLDMNERSFLKAHSLQRDALARAGRRQRAHYPLRGHRQKELLMRRSMTFGLRAGVALVPMFLGAAASAQVPEAQHAPSAAEDSLGDIRGFQMFELPPSEPRASVAGGVQRLTAQMACRRTQDHRPAHERQDEIDPMITHVISLDHINNGFGLVHSGRSIRSRDIF